MRFYIDELEVFFPYDYLYKEQIEYMTHLKRALDSKGHGLLEMPTGTGKTVCVLSLITSYKYKYPKIGRLVYCTRTVPEMTKCMDEIKKVIKYRESLLGLASSKILAVCLSARRNLCIHKGVLEETDGENVDSSCRGMTASWIRSRHDSTLCSYFENFDKSFGELEIPRGIYDLNDLKNYGELKGLCPYFLTRYLINHSDIIVFNYQYLLDPKVSNLVSRELGKDCVVIFDEAHNIDNVCIEALSVALDTRAMDLSIKNIHKLQNKINDLKASDNARLQQEYRDLLSGLTSQGLIRTNNRQNNTSSNATTNTATSTESNSNTSSSDIPTTTNLNPIDTDVKLASPLLSSDILEEAIPGSIRKAEHFIAFLRKIVIYLKSQFKGVSVESKSPLYFMNSLQEATALERKPLKFTQARLQSLLRTLEITSLEEYNPLSDISNFITLLATYTEGFAIIFEPQGSIVKGVYEPLLQLACLDASISIKPVFDRFQSVIITSGTLSPLSLYPKLLNFQPIISQSLPMSIFRPCLLPLIVTRGSDQIPISTKFETRGNDSIARDYGLLLVDVCSNVPDGVCCFFPSYQYMEETIQAWDRMNIIPLLLKHKLLFLETKDVVETTLALDNFKLCCDTGKGALFLSISRGKVAEGIDFDKHYGRCVIVLGVPYQYTRSQTLLARLDFMSSKYKIKGNDFLTFDALRQSSQCIGRVIRSKTDYGVVILADSRFNRQDKRSKFPPWVLGFMRESSLNLSTDLAIEQIKTFLRYMGQPIDQKALRSILLDQNEVQLITRKMFNENLMISNNYNPTIDEINKIVNLIEEENDNTETIVLMKRELDNVNNINNNENNMSISSTNISQNNISSFLKDDDDDDIETIVQTKRQRIDINNDNVIGNQNEMIQSENTSSTVSSQNNISSYIQENDNTNSTVLMPSNENSIDNNQIDIV